MIKIRHSDDRGQVDFGWLKSQHTFSFGQYHDPAHMGFGPLRVINEDHIDARRGFDTHAHDNMEIVTYVMSGQLSHEDSMGNSSSIKPNEVQRMSAGTGIKHSEYNHSDDDVHLLQIWFLPEKKNIEPSYEQKFFDKIDNALNLVLSQSGQDNSVSLNQDINMFAGHLNKNKALSHDVNPERKQWLQLIKGSITLNDHVINVGDGVAITGEKSLFVKANDDAHFIVMDMGA